MGGNSFTFKQFTVLQEGVAMKIGVDSVLLGAWCNLSNVQKVLDVGCGTGILALMVAQRNNDAVIDAIELDENAATIAATNVQNSNFNNQISVFKGDFCLYSPGSTYDCIIANPPYFEHSLQAATIQRTLARHTNALSYESLLNRSKKLLNASGHLSLILPHRAFGRFDNLARDTGFYCCEKWLVIPFPDAEPNRVLLRYGFTKTTPLVNSITVRNSDRTFSNEYKELTKEFYL
jgi:tRNA1Val (adenine37-N6)-methyltransferase